MTGGGDHGRAGASVVEALVAALLGLFLLSLGLRTLARVRSAEAGFVARRDALVALRLSRHVLRTELGRSRAQLDWSVDADSLSLRAFRGTALVCSIDSAAASIIVSYRGERAPDPAKDSVLLVGSDGLEVARDLVMAGAGPGCDTTGGAAGTWRLDSPAPVGTLLARLYERGSYHLSGHALRYRRGGSGRQPLTAEVWSASTGWAPSGTRLGVDLIPRASNAGPPWSGFLAWTTPE